MVMSSFTMVNEFEATKLTIKSDTCLAFGLHLMHAGAFWMILLPLPTRFAFCVSESNEIRH